MKEYKILLHAAIVKQRKILLVIWLMMFMSILCMGTGLTIFHSGNEVVTKEMNRLGFGDFTIWLNNNASNLSEEIENIPEVESISMQPLIYAGYEINGAYSDNDGQLLIYNESVPYQFVSADGSSLNISEIEAGTIYISPAMKSSFDIEIGDVITFELARSQGKRELTVAGYFADPFMGSSMIDMKSFLINETDYLEMKSLIENTPEVDRLGKIGAMLHVFKDDSASISDQELLSAIYETTDISLHTEFSYQAESILSYMLLLQNILSGFFLVFSIVMMLITIVITGKSIQDVIEEEKRDIAVLKTLGLEAKKLRNIYFTLYEGDIILGCLAGLLLIHPLSSMLARALITSTGLLVAVQIPISCIVVIGICLILFWIYLYMQTTKILLIVPMEIIRYSVNVKRVYTRIKGGYLTFAIATREILSKKLAYTGVFIISVLLVIFLSVVGKMGNWLGENGEGLMNAFSVAEHDIGVQPYSNDVPMDEIERVINWYSPILRQYELAMQEVNVGGLSVTANVLNDTNYFHILEGEVCDGDEILITETIANELNIGIGDTVIVTGAGRQATYRVSGIYQCANGMGSNIGMSLSGYSKIGDTTGFIWCYHYVLEDGSIRDYIIEYLQENYEGVDIHSNSWSGLSGIVAMMHGLMLFIYIVTAGFVLLTVILTSGKLLRTESANMAIYKSIGMTNQTLRVAFVIRFIMVVTVGSIIGALITQGIADTLIEKIFSNFGIASFQSNLSISGNVLPVVLLIMMFTVFAWMMSAKIEKISIAGLLAENEE